MAARITLPPLARSAGYELEFHVLETRLLGPLRLGDVRLRDPRGSDLRASNVELTLSLLPDLLWHPRRIFHRIRVEGLSGSYQLTASVPDVTSPGVTGPAPFFTPAWPMLVEVGVDKVFVSRGTSHFYLKDAELVLTTGRPGVFRAGEAGIMIGNWRKKFSGLRATTAWRDGVAYLADMPLDNDAFVELFSAALAGPDTFRLRARAFGGSLYGEWAGGGARTTAALNASDISFRTLGRFLDMKTTPGGRLGLLKLTFNGDPSAPLDAQISMRAEADDFSAGARAFRNLRVGLSLSGRRLKVDDLHLTQKANRVAARGLFSLPARDWRSSELRLEVAGTVRDSRALAELAGPPWDKISGGLDFGASVTGTLGQPSGWLKARGWNLRLPGLPPGTLQADVLLRDSSVKITCLESHSGPNFLRGSGEISLRDEFSYRGRMEVRIREVAHYLKPLGRMAPDWAREGGLFLLWDGDGSGETHSGVVSLELYDFTGKLNAIPVNGQFAATYSPGNVYISKLLLNRGPLSLSASGVLSGAGLSLGDIQLFNGRRRLLRGEVFLPVSYPLLLEGKAWSQVMVPGKDIRATIFSDDLQLAALANLFGQSAFVDGHVDWKLDASGPWENPLFESTLTIDKFGASFDNFVLPSSRIECNATLAKQRLDISGRLDAGAEHPVTFDASIPLLGRNEAGGFRLLDRSRPASARLDLPFLDLAKFASVRPMSGRLGGSVSLSGRLAAPSFDGALRWEKVVFSPVDGLAPVDAFDGRLVFAGSGAKCENAGGQMGEGAFTLQGGFDFAELMRPSFSAKISGENLQLLDKDKFRIAGDVELSIGETEQGRSVAGEIALTSGRADVSLAAVPFLRPLGKTLEPTPLTAPFRVRGLLAGAGASIRVRTRQPVLLSGGAKTSVDLLLGGKAGAFVPVGQIGVEGLQAGLPSGPINFTRAAFSFGREMPWVPVLDLAGSTQAGLYRVNVKAWGPLGRQQIKFESAPELSPGQIALLLGAGISPETGAGRGDFNVGVAPSPAPELPPSAFGYSWEVR